MDYIHIMTKKGGSQRYGEKPCLKKQKKGQK